MDYGCMTAGENPYLAKRPLFLDTLAHCRSSDPDGEAAPRKSKYSCSGVNVNLVAINQFRIPERGVTAVTFRLSIPCIHPAFGKTVKAF
ncbi:UNVERIFIED_ORG: hypothetical protein M2435_003456 [Rhizobium sophorae]|nr:hypothetical protein [Rhizobium leguminosarum]MDH6660542.1 hypothetical protein [Rhizobium sophorae]